MFYDTFSRGLVAPGDPAGADVVLTATTWPVRLTTDRPDTTFPAQSCSARLSTLANLLSGKAITMHLPPISGLIAGQNQGMPAVPINTDGVTYPGFLPQVRDAASNGLAWWAAQGAQVGSPGSLVLNYARWETVNHRTLSSSQIIAGPPTTAASSWVMTKASWTGTSGTGTQTTYNAIGATDLAWGVTGPAFRIYGDVSIPGAERNAVSATTSELLTDHQDPGEQTLSTIDVQSGARYTPTGQPSDADWDPYAHTFGPTDTLQVTQNDGQAHTYRVIKSDHRLTAAVWQTTHTLEKYIPPTALP
jgi:hypothetical protein